MQKINGAKKYGTPRSGEMTISYRVGHSSAIDIDRDIDRDQISQHLV